MKKKLIAISTAALMLLSLTACGNKQMFDTKYTFDRAIICLPNGEVVDGEVESWTDYEGEQLQIKIDGVTYLTSSYNAVLIAD